MSEQKTVARAIFFDQHNIMHDHDKHWREANQGIWLSAADAALAAMNKREPITDSGWRPIAEAPKDGTRVLCITRSGQQRVDFYRWSEIPSDPYTHFRLLPPPPDGGPGK